MFPVQRRLCAACYGTVDGQGGRDTDAPETSGRRTVRPAGQLGPDYRHDLVNLDAIGDVAGYQDRLLCSRLACAVGQVSGKTSSQERFTGYCMRTGGVSRA